MNLTYTHVDRVIVGGVMPVGGDVKLETVDALKAAQPEIMRAASKGVMHKNTASRKISRLASRVKALAS